MTARPAKTALITVWAASSLVYLLVSLGATFWAFDFDTFECEKCGSRKSVRRLPLRSVEVWLKTVDAWACQHEWQRPSTTWHNTRLSLSDLFWIIATVIALRPRMLSRVRIPPGVAPWLVIGGLVIVVGVDCFGIAEGARFLHSAGVGAITDVDWVFQAKVWITVDLWHLGSGLISLGCAAIWLFSRQAASVRRAKESRPEPTSNSPASS